jgi:hypothetical protein
MLNVLDQGDQFFCNEYARAHPYLKDAVQPSKKPHIPGGRKPFPKRKLFASAWRAQ